MKINAKNSKYRGFNNYFEKKNVRIYNKLNDDHQPIFEASTK